MQGHQNHARRAVGCLSGGLNASNPIPTPEARANVRVALEALLAAQRAIANTDAPKDDVAVATDLINAGVEIGLGLLDLV